MGLNKEVRKELNEQADLLERLLYDRNIYVPDKGERRKDLGKYVDALAHCLTYDVSKTAMGNYKNNCGLGCIDSSVPA